MKTKIIFLLGIVALVTLSFTFSSVTTATPRQVHDNEHPTDPGQVMGFISDEVLK